MMNRLLLTAARSLAPSLRNTYSGETPPAARSFAVRHLSESSPPSAPPEGEAATFTYGTVKKSFNPETGFGFIRPDGVDRREHDAKDLFILDPKHIKTPANLGGAGLWPMPRQGQRVRFRAGPPREGYPQGKGEGGGLSQGARSRSPPNVSEPPVVFPGPGIMAVPLGSPSEALEVTQEDGRLIPPFYPKYLARYIKRQKDGFGRELFNIFGATDEDHHEMEARIFAAYDRASDNIRRMREKVRRADEIYSREEEGSSR